MGGERKVYTLAEVSEHNDPKDCWLVIDGKVCRIFLRDQNLIQFGLKSSWVCVFCFDGFCNFFSPWSWWECNADVVQKIYRELDRRDLIRLHLGFDAIYL